MSPGDKCPGSSLCPSWKTPNAVSGRQSLCASLALDLFTKHPASSKSHKEEALRWALSPQLLLQDASSRAPRSQDSVGKCPAQASPSPRWGHGGWGVLGSRSRGLLL